MSSRYWVSQRKGIFYYENTFSRKQFSLKTRDRKEAEALLAAKSASRWAFLVGPRELPLERRPSRVAPASVNGPENQRSRLSHKPQFGSDGDCTCG
jgi:hypothetical protein